MMTGLTSMGQSAAPEVLKASANVLGLLTQTATQWCSGRAEGHGIDNDAVEAFIRERAEARARKDFKESDRIRDELAAMGVVLKDGKDADGKPVTTWEIAR
jgi:cysteinyl-tRNA synthetase